MRRLVLGLALAGTLLSAAAAPVEAGMSPTGRGQAAGQHAARFSTDGLWVVDARHRKLILRGLDVMGAEFTPTGSPLPYGPSDFVTMRQMGATVVRLPIAWANIEPVEGTYDPAALARVDQIVSWAGAAGLDVVLDMHQWNWSPCFGGNGMPEWATNPCPRDTSASEADVGEESVAETQFWASGDLQARFAAAWARVVSSLAAANGGAVPSFLVGYDLFNEPPGGLVPPALFDNVVLPAFYRLAASAVRRADPAALVVVEPPLLADPARTTMAQLGIAGAVYSPHLYGDSLNDASGDAGDFAGPAQFTPDLGLGSQEAKRLGAAFWPGEWGYLNPAATVSYQEDQYATDMLAAQDQAMVGSAYWTYWKPPSAPPGQWPWTAAIRAILTRPSPYAIAGTPVSFSTAPHQLRVSWVSDGGATLVSLPASMQPRVSVISGPVTATPLPGGWLQLRAPAGVTASVVVAG